jgi:transcriptional regulator with XRE-family HTH domain
MDQRIEAEGLAMPDGETPGERLSVVRAVLARNLRAERLRHRLSRRDVIERTGMPSSRVTAIEAGRGNATIDDMAKLAVLLETPLWKLLKP